MIEKFLCACRAGQRICFKIPVLGHGEFSWQSKAKDIVVEELVSHGFPALVRCWISLS